MLFAQEAGQYFRGSTLIYHSNKTRSRTHIRNTDTAWACSQRPKLSVGLVLLLFPFTAIFTCGYFITKVPVLSRNSRQKVKNIIAKNGKICYSVLIE